MGRAAFPALLIVWLLVLAGSVSTARPATPLVAAQAVAAAVSSRSFVDAHCAACHNDRVRTAGLSLDGLDPADIGDRAELWETVLQKLRTGQMPPAGRPRPDPAALTAMMSTLATALDRSAAANPSPGRVGLHRLNRAEYANAIRDLLQLEIDTPSLLLPDEADEGFDNVAASLALSPAHLERYLTAARHISQIAVGDSALGAAPGSSTYRVPKLLEQDVRAGEAMPFGSRGGVAVRHYFPLEGEYVFTVRLRRQVYDYIIGMGQPQHLDVRIDGARVNRFTVGGQAKGTPGPMTWNGEIVGDTPWELYMHAADAGIEVRAAVAAGARMVTAAFVDSPWEPEGVAQPLQVDFGRGADEQYDGYAAVDALTIAGPYRPGGAGDTASRRAIFSCRPARAADEAACAKSILSTLARRAYRRPVTADEVGTLLAFYETARRERGFEAGIQSAIERLLVSFNFLFRVEQEPPDARPGSVHRISDLELASRLSFFLWSSVPDEELLDLAEAGRLANAGVLARQVRRMLADPRATALVDNFGSQWLGLRKAVSWQPNPDIFPEFDENLRQAFLRETSLFLDSQFREDRSVVDLLSADYSFLNERLAEHYGVKGVQGERFRKVTFTVPARGGLLGQGGILMVTSYPDRTAPVLRGFWVLDNLLGMPPPPPPPDIPELEPTGADGRALSMREQMETHRRNPACAVCHVRMDPLGFSLEQFDAIGRWRTRTNGVAIDAAAVFADGTPIDGGQGLRKFLLTHRENFVHTFVSKLLTYALGRHVGYPDQPAIRAMMRESSAGEYRWSAIIVSIVQSAPFQMRKTPS